jgi:2-octaprenyl-6-methoxyphenol hydroxylase
MSERFDIIVVGAGPAGLAAALLAERTGRRVALVGPPAPADRRTAALLAGSVELMRRLGAWQELSTRAAPLRRIRIVDGTERLIRAPEVLFDSAEIGLEAFGYNLENATITGTLANLVERRGIGRFRDRAEAADILPDEAAVRLADGRQVSGRLIVAADGRNSCMRMAAGIAASEWRYGQTALVVNLRHELGHDDVSTEFHTETGPFTLVPLAGKRSSLVWVERPEEASRLAGLDDAALSQAVERRARSFLGAMSVDSARQTFPIAGMSARQMAQDRIALVGEAGHVLPPIGAQGLNIGLADVAALEPVFMAEDAGSPEQLARYDSRRHSDVTRRSTIIDGMNRSLLSGFLPVQAARGFGLFLLGNVPALRRAAMRSGLTQSSER